MAEKDNSETNGRKRKYLTIDDFDRWRNNEFYHLKLQIKYMMGIALAILGGVIGNFFVG
jgi:hypothetical protein